MSLELVVRQTDADIAEEKRLDQHTYFECRNCGKRAWTSLRFIESHQDGCKRRN